MAPEALRSVPGWARAALAAGGLLVLLGVEALCNRAGIPVGYLVAERTSRSTTEALALAAVVSGALAPRAHRTSALLFISLLAYPLLLGPMSILVAAYGLGVCGLVRVGVPLALRVALALLAWSALPVCRWCLSPGSAKELTLYLMLVWAGLAYSTIYLLVERSRLSQRPSLSQDLFYLLALPRVLNPFFQPLSPNALRRAEERTGSLRSLGQGVVLGGYAMLLEALSSWLRRFSFQPHLSVLGIPAEILVNYCAIAKTIFVAVSLFRLMGFDLASGFRQPFAAVSFADYFSRFNHYVRDAVLSLFFIPLFMRLHRRFSPRVATILASYGAILVGSFILNQLLVPVVTSVNWQSSLKANLDPFVLLTMFAYWTAIVVPSASLSGAPSQTTGSWPRWVRVARFLTLYLALWAGLWMLRNPPSEWFGVRSRSAPIKTEVH